MKNLSLQQKFSRYLDQHQQVIDLADANRNQTDSSHGQTWLQNTFDLSDFEFKSRFRLNKTTFRYFVDQVIVIVIF